MPFAARSAFEELGAQQAELKLRFEELSDAHRKIAAQADQLHTVNLLGRELTQHTELGPLADAILRLLTERFKATGVRLWLAPRDGASEQLLCQAGEGGATPERQLVLSAGRSLGRIELWGTAAARLDQADLLDDLVPWLSIALENARSFGLLREYQTDLEKRVTERTAQLEEALKRQTEADRQRSEFFANASHELRTPLTLMLAPLEALTTDDDLPEASREEIRGALKNAYRLLKLVNDLLDLSKLEAGRMRLELATTDLARLLEEVVRSWRPVVARRGISFQLSGPPSLPLIADPERLEQVVLNLVSNAVKHTPEGGQVRVTVAEAGEWAELVVENTGEGIDPDDLPRLFDRFAQSLRSRSRRFGTTGLGLPVVRELVELHDGTVEVENVPGERVAFRVRLPRGASAEQGPAVIPRPARAELLQYEVSAEPSAPPTPTEPNGDRPLLLLAEDNAEMRAFLAKSLRDEYEIIEAADGDDALRMANQRLPDLVLSDLMMPGRDGLELCRELKSHPATLGIPFVLLSARGDLEQRVGALHGGADDYLVKPFHLLELKARLSAQLRLRALAVQVGQSEKLASLGTLVAGVAHEVRNPLNGVLNALLPLKEMLVAPSEAVSELLDIAIGGARQLERIASQLLLQARAGESTHSTVDLAQNVAFAVQMLSHKVEQGPRIVARLPEGPPITVIGEPGALNQVWVNLIDNALQAAGTSGTVVVAVGRDGDRTSVEVSDDGPGISPKDLKRIFDPFYTTKPVGSGTGLGLAVVRRLVECHRGQISVDSRPGVGTRFKVTLPTASSSTGDLHAEG